MPYVASTPQYATTADLANHMGAPALAAPAIAGAAIQNAQLVTASAKVDSYLRSRFTLPLVQWGDDLVQATCRLAAYALIRVRGYNPDSEADKQYDVDRKETEAWLKDIASGKATPDVVDSSPGATVGSSGTSDSPQVVNPPQDPAVPIGYWGSTRGTSRR